jgi:hypothetical protein
MILRKPKSIQNILGIAVTMLSVAGLGTPAVISQTLPNNNATLRPGTSIQSQNQCFQLAAQNDGNLVLYKKSTRQALWSSGTYGRSVQYTIFQSDGNLVIYDPSNRPLWASGTDNKGATRLTLQDDGNLVIYTAQNRPLWATNTVTSCGNNTTPATVVLFPNLN